MANTFRPQRLVLALVLFAAFPGLAAEPPAACGSGLSAGVHLGGGWGTTGWVDSSAGDIGNGSSSGWLGGLQVAWGQRTGEWGWGVRADVSWAGIEGTHPDAVFGTGGPYPQSDRAKTDLLGTITGQAGYSLGPAFVYARGGAAWARTRYSLEGYFAPGAEFAAGRSTRWGWTVGAGLEYRIAGPWTASAEYGYIDLGTEHVELQCLTQPGCGAAGANSVGIDVRAKLHVVKIGLDYRF